MTMFAALRESAGIYRKNLGDCLLTLLLQLVLRLMAASPLLFLVAPETRALALLSIPLFVLIVLPARQNAAIAMQDMLSGGRIFSMQLVSTKDYWKKVGRGVKQALLMLLWGSLWLAATAFALVVYSGKTIEGVTDVFTILRTLMALGGGSSIQGAKMVVLIYMATLLPVMVGFAFHSGTRHAVALGEKKLLHGKRCKVMLVWLASLITLLPFLAAVAWIVLGLVGALSQALASLGSGSISLPPMGQNVYILAAAFVVLLLPMIPLKQLIPAVYMRSVKENVK